MSGPMALTLKSFGRRFQTIGRVVVLVGNPVSHIVILIGYPISDVIQMIFEAI